MDQGLAQSIGKAARAARGSLKLTQEDAAERIGVSVEFYSRIERGTALPSLTTFVRMAVVLNVRTDVMIGMDSIGDDSALSPELLLKEQEERPEIRRILRRLRKASPGTLRIITTLLKEMERASPDRDDDDE